MHYKKGWILIFLSVGLFMACGNGNTNNQDGTGEMPESPTYSTGEAPYQPQDTADVDTIRLDSMQ